eukprot:SAG11_NODE_157_length_14147_cov_8.545202_17_plen_56_part_00
MPHLATESTVVEADADATAGIIQTMLLATIGGWCDAVLSFSYGTQTSYKFTGAVL